MNIRAKVLKSRSFIVNFVLEFKPFTSSQHIATLLLLFSIAFTAITIISTPKEFYLNNAFSLSILSTIVYIVLAVAFYIGSSIDPTALTTDKSPLLVAITGPLFLVIFLPLFLLYVLCKISLYPIIFPLKWLLKFILYATKDLDKTETLKVTLSLFFVLILMSAILTIPLYIYSFIELIPLYFFFSITLIFVILSIIRDYKKNSFGNNSPLWYRSIDTIVSEVEYFFSVGKFGVSPENIEIWEMQFSYELKRRKLSQKSIEEEIRRIKSDLKQEMRKLQLNGFTQYESWEKSLKSLVGLPANMATGYSNRVGELLFAHSSFLYLFMIAFMVSRYLYDMQIVNDLDWYLHSAFMGGFLPAMFILRFTRRNYWTSALTKGTRWYKRARLLHLVGRIVVSSIVVSVLILILRPACMQLLILVISTTGIVSLYVLIPIAGLSSMFGVLAFVHVLETTIVSKPIRYFFLFGRSVFDQFFTQTYR